MQIGEINILSKTDVTDINPDILSLWLPVTNLKPMLITYERMTMYRGIQKFKEIQFVTDNPSITMTKHIPVTARENISKLWSAIHKRIGNNQYRCCICGKVDDFSRKYGLGYNKYTCMDGTFEQTPCQQIRNEMRYILSKYLKRIKNQDRKACCWNCGIEYQPKRSDAKFCSLKCRVAHHRVKSPINEKITT